MKRILAAWSVLIVGLTVASCGTNEVPTGPEPSGRTGYGVLPSGVVVDSAHLMVHVRHAAGLMIVVHPQETAWDESSVTWNDIGAGVSPYVIGTFNITDTGWVSVDVSGLMLLWLGGTWENYGILLDQNAPEYFRNSIDSRETGRLAPRMRLFSSSDTTLVQEFYAVADADIQADQPGMNAGGDSALYSGWTDHEPGERRTLIQFDFSTPPPIPYSSIGDRVWRDVNMNGLQDDGEEGLPGVTVNLRDCKEVLIESTTTDENGLYTFDSLDADSYVIEFVCPEGYGYSDPWQGNDTTLDSDADKITGFTFCVRVPRDTDDDTRDAGMYLLPPDPTAMLGDRVWNDVDMDGVQDDGEPGVAGILVTLLGCDGQRITETHTNGDGMYGFESLDAGSYKLQFSAPDGWQFSPLHGVEDPELDSDAHPDHGQTVCIELDGGVQDGSWDAGVFETPPDPVSAIGDRVWNDVDMDGVQDDGEPGVAGLLVTLLNCDGQRIAETHTNGDGIYWFESLNAGAYRVQFVVPGGWLFSPKRAADDPELDSDAHPETGRTVCFELSAGVEDASWDAGVFEPAVEPSLGCTRIRWYWRHHSGAHGEPDEVSPHLPIWLGTPGGAESFLVETSGQAYDVLSHHNHGTRFNGLARLYSALLTTKLNLAEEASPDAIADVVEGVDVFLATHRWEDWPGMNKDTRMKVWTWWFYMKLYNWGIIGPGMCDYECDFVAAAADDEDWYADEEK